MNAKDREIAKLCIQLTDWMDDEPIDRGTVRGAIERIHRLVNPEFDALCNQIEDCWAGVFLDDEEEE